MPGRQRSRAAAVLAGREKAKATATTLGANVRVARRRRGWPQRLMGEKVGLTSQRIGQLERGKGSGASLDLWYAIATALGMSLTVEFGRDRLTDAADAGHLRLQEVVLRLGRESGRQRTFELPTRPLDPGLSVDVCLRDDQLRVLLLIECWTTFGSINASVRSTRRKLAEAEALGVALAGGGPAYRVAGCWVVRDTRRNRELVARYPEVFASTFVGSSSRWVGALTRSGTPPPDELGLAWCTRDATRLFAWRRRQG